MFELEDSGMHLKKLDQSFYNNHTHLQEALDNSNGSWAQGKVRGYGVVVISINNLIFAVPLRSNIRHKAAYITVRSQVKGSKGKGLDFSKAMLITQQSYISTSPFKISSDEHKKLQNKEVHIIKRFEKYVSKYILAVEKGDQNILKSAEYRFTTLINYHVELGVTHNENGVAS